jgi:hypothetical protein
MRASGYTSRGTRLKKGLQLDKRTKLHLAKRPLSLSRLNVFHKFDLVGLEHIDLARVK